MSDTEQSDGTKTKRVKHPVPDGFDTPSELITYLSYHEIADVSAQTVYGWARTQEDFPKVEHTDGRTIIDREKAVEWVKNHMVKVAEAKAKRSQGGAKRQEKLLTYGLTFARDIALRVTDRMAEAAKAE